MERKTFNTTINAPREKVWEVLWGDESYRQWTRPFSENSRAETDWKEGSRILFLGGDNQDGMVSEVAERRDNEYMSIRHIGAINNGVEDFDSPQTKAWAGAMENYILTDKDGSTELKVEMDLGNEEDQSMAKMWPKALEILKELSEKK